MPSLVDFTHRRGSKKLSLFVCLSVTLLNVRDCSPDFAMKALEYRISFHAVGQGKVCSCASVFNFVRLVPFGDTLNAEVQKIAKNGFFANRG